MGTFIDLLAVLHSTLTQVFDLQERLLRGPKQVKIAEANVLKCEADVVQAKDALKKARIASDSQQLTLKQRDARIYELEGKRNAAANNKEYQLLKDQIAADKQATSVLSDEILEGFERLETLAGNIQSLELILSKTKEDLEKVKLRVNESTETIEADLARAKERLAQYESKLSDEARLEYDRVVKGRGHDALAPAENGSCGGCFQTLAPQTIDLLLRDRMVLCKSCGRMLYTG